MDVEDLEERVLGKLNELLASLDIRYSDKENTRKKISMIEKNVRNLFDMVLKKDDGLGSNEAEDSMFTKKSAVNCASCDKEVVNLQGTKADYLAWKRLPFREAPNDRIAKYGQGFSKMLNLIKVSEPSQDVRNFE